METMEPKEEKRTRQLMIRLMPIAEGDVLDAAARKVGLPTGTWLRTLGMTEARKMAAKDEKK